MFLAAATIAVASVVTALLVSFYLQIPAQSTFSLQDVPRLSADKTFVVTGANSGIGLAAVRHLAEAGTASTIVMGCRSALKCQKAKSEIQFFRDAPTAPVKTRLRCLELDLKSLDSIRRFAAEVQKVLPPATASSSSSSVPPLEVLINNAGIMGERHDNNADGDDLLVWNNETGAEMHMHVNHLGHFMLTSLLMDNLKASSKTPTVVSVSSIAAMLPALNVNDIKLESWRSSPSSGSKQKQQQPWYARYLSTPFVKGIWAYAASKRANLLFAHELQKRYSSIRSVASHPGGTDTNILVTGCNFLPQWVVDRYIEFVRYSMMTPEEGGLTTIKAALDPTLPGYSYVGPKWVSTGEPMHIGTATKSMHHFYGPIRNAGGKEDGSTFWQKSEEALGIKFG